MAKFINLVKGKKMNNQWRYKELLTIFELDEIKDMTRDNAEEFLTERIGAQDIIYCNRAMSYLTEYDSSLYDSLGLAMELGYEVKDLNSEILATLLYQDKLKDELNYFLDDYFFKIYIRRW